MGISFTKFLTDNHVVTVYGNWAVLVTENIADLLGVVTGNHTHGVAVIAADAVGQVTPGQAADADLTGRWRAEDPAFAILQRRLHGVETGADGNTVDHIANHTRQAACGDDGINTRATGDVSGLQFGGHTAGPQTRHAVTGNTAQGVVDGGDFTD